MVIVHVDDFMVAGENMQLACVAQTLSDAFTMKIITKFNRHLSVNFEFAKNGKEVSHSESHKFCEKCSSMSWEGCWLSFFSKKH